MSIISHYFIGFLTTIRGKAFLALPLEHELGPYTAANALLSAKMEPRCIPS